MRGPEGVRRVHVTLVPQRFLGRGAACKLMRAGERATDNPAFRRIEDDRDTFHQIQFMSAVGDQQLVTGFGWVAIRVPGRDFRGYPDDRVAAVRSR
jgi:hypothetical protein